jgi:hypothetical protein
MVPLHHAVIHSPFAPASSLEVPLASAAAPRAAVAVQSPTCANVTQMIYPPSPCEITHYMTVRVTHRRENVSHVRCAR